MAKSREEALANLNRRVSEAAAAGNPVPEADVNAAMQLIDEKFGVPLGGKRPMTSTIKAEKRPDVFHRELDEKERESLVRLQVHQQTGIPLSKLGNINKDFLSTGLSFSIGFSDTNKDIKRKIKEVFPEAKLSLVKVGGVKRVPAIMRNFAELERRIKEKDPAIRDIIAGRVDKRVPEGENLKLFLRSGGRFTKGPIDSPIAPHYGFVNPQGFQATDIARGVGPSLPAIGAIAGGMLSKGPVIGPTTGHAAGSFLRRQINNLFFGGTKTEPEKGVGAKVAEDFAASVKESIPTAILGSLAKIGFGIGGHFMGKSPIKRMPEDIQRQVGEVTKMRTGVERPRLMIDQAQPQRPIMARTGARVRTMTAQGQDIERAQRQFGAKVIREREPRIKDSDIKALNQYLEKGVEVARKAEVKTFTGKGVGSNEQIMKELQTGMKGAVEKSRKIVSKAYKDVDDMATRKGADIRYNISGSMDKVRDIENKVRTMAIGQEGQAVQVSAGPSGDLLSIIKRIKALHPEQTTATGAVTGAKSIPYQTIKTLRTDLGRYIETAVDPRLKAEAIGLYRTMTKDLFSPVKAPEGFIMALDKANKMAAKRFDVMKTIDQSFSKVLASRNPAELYKEFSDPNKINSQVMKFMREHNPKNFENFRALTLGRWMSETKNATEALKKLQTQNPEALRILLKTENASKSVQASQMKKLEQFAHHLDRWNASNAGAVYLKQLAQFDKAEKAIFRGDKTRTMDIKDLMKTIQMGGATRSQARKFVRDFAYNRVARRSITAKDELDVRALHKTIVELKEAGLWRYLSSTDRLNISGAKNWELILKNLKESGTDLVAASYAAQMTDPSRWGKIAAMMGTNRVAASLMSSKAVQRRIFAPGKPFETAPKALVYMNEIMRSMLDAMEPGPQKGKIRGLKIRIE